MKRVIVKGGRAVGVELENSEMINARMVASNAGPKLLFTKLVDAPSQPPEFLGRMKNFACGSGTFRMNVALSSGSVI